MTDATTPLLDLLRAVPTDARVIYQHSLTDHSIIPAGRLCHEAAAEIARLTAERARIDAAPVAVIDTRDVLGLCAPDEADFPALYALQGHRVALVDLGMPAARYSNASSGQLADPAGTLAVKPSVELSR